MFTPQQWLLLQVLVHNYHRPVVLAPDDLEAYLDLKAKLDGLIAAARAPKPPPAEPPVTEPQAD